MTFPNNDVFNCRSQFFMKQNRCILHVNWLVCSEVKTLLVTPCMFEVEKIHSISRLAKKRYCSSEQIMGVIIALIV
jgi:hypothetical protein